MARRSIRNHLLDRGETRSAIFGVTNDLVTRDRRVTPVCDIKPRLEYVIRLYQDGGAKVALGKVPGRSRYKEGVEST